MVVLLPVSCLLQKKKIPKLDGILDLPLYNLKDNAEKLDSVWFAPCSDLIDKTYAVIIFLFSLFS